MNNMQIARFTSIAIFMLLVFVSCRSDVTSSGAPPSPPTVFNIHFDYSGQQTGSLTFDSSSQTMEEWQTLNYAGSEAFDFLAARFIDTIQKGGPVNGVQISLRSKTPIQEGQIFTESDSSSLASATIGFVTSSIILPGPFPSYTAKQLTVKVSYFSYSNAAAGTFSGVFQDTAGHQLIVRNGSFSLPK